MNFITICSQVFSVRLHSQAAGRSRGGTGAARLQRLMNMGTHVCAFFIFHGYSFQVGFKETAKRKTTFLLGPRMSFCTHHSRRNVETSSSVDPEDLNESPTNISSSFSLGIHLTLESRTGSFDQQFGSALLFFGYVLV